MCWETEVRGYQNGKEPAPLGGNLQRLASPHAILTWRASSDFEKTKPGVIGSEPELRSKDIETLSGMSGRAIGSYEDMMER